MSEIKITPAMAEWCRALRDLTDCRLVRETYGPSEYQKTYIVEGPLRKAKPTWAMVARLEQAGLIQWENRGAGRRLYVVGLPDRTIEHVALLTAAGRAESEKDMPVVVQTSATWPFPVSAHTESTS